MDKNAYIYNNVYKVLSREDSMNKKDERIYKVIKRHKGFARTKDILAAGIKL